MLLVKKIPAITASASEDSEGKIHISLANLNPNKAIDVTCSLEGNKKNKVTGEILTADHITDYNDCNFPEKVAPRKFTGITRNQDEIKIQMPAKSVVILKIS